MDHADWVAPVVAGCANGRPLGLVFDYGGALAAPAAHPSLALLPDRTRDLLAELAALSGVTVGVASGRAVYHLRDLVGLPGVRYAGSSGQHLDLGGTEVLDPAAAEFDRLADAIVVVISDAVEWFPGAWVERKPGCLTVHYRALSRLKAACFRDEVYDALLELTATAALLRVRDTAAALEITLAGSWTKGDAVGRLLADGGPTLLPVYAAGGANDEEAVDRVNAGRGVTVGVGPEAPPRVGHRVATAADLAADLGRLTALLARSRPRVVRAGEPVVVPSAEAV